MSSNSYVFKAFFLIMCRCVFACGHMHVSVGAQRGPRHQSPAAKFVCVWFVCGGHMYLYICIHVKT